MTHLLGHEKSYATGFSKDELVNRKKYQDITSPKHEEYGAKALERMLKTGESCSYEKEYSRKDGCIVPALVTAFPVKNGDGKTVVAIGTIVKDITQIKKQQKQLEMASAELTRSNSELEQFASIASHDLLEPLRTISIYLQLIERKNEANLDRDSKEYLNFAVDGSKRLSELIGDLLTYSQVGAKKAALRDFDTNESVQEALTCLRQAIAENEAKLEIGPLPTICADSKSFVQLFQNLIGNAVKYHSKEPPLIKIGAIRGEDGWTFQVEDNGIGIEQKATARIFDMFHRLHARSEFPGTGIGLAICKKISEQRGGKIWVESEAGKGSTFFFTVPDALPCA